jgi:hypothetical protein
MPVYDPKWPVIDPEPTIDKCVKSMRVRDYVMFTSVTAASWVYGYMAGFPVRKPTATTAATIGMTFASILILQDTRARFMGYQENDAEVKKYGIHPTAQPIKHPEQDPLHPTSTGLISETVRPPHDWKSYYK